MKTLKAKFGKFAISAKDLQMVKGGRCPKSLQPKGACEKHWKGDAEGTRRCRATCGHEIYPGPWK